MSANTDGAPIAMSQLAALPAEAQAFHRRARILDAAVREIAQCGYGQAAVTDIAARAGVTRRAFYDTFADKEEALIWAYDAAAAYAIPLILQALHAQRSWARGAAAALSTYLAILDCDRDWALVCLRDVPAAGDRVRAARDEIRAPVMEALTHAPRPGAGAVRMETIVTGIDAIAVNGLRQDPSQPLVERQRELAVFALAPFIDDPGRIAPVTGAAPIRTSADDAEIEALLDGGSAGRARLERLVREAALRRDGPTLWAVVATVQRRRADGRPMEQIALDALGQAWFFGLPLDRLDQPHEDADSRYVAFLAAHPGASGADVMRGLGLGHLSQVNRTLRRLEREGLLIRAPGVGRANAWTITQSSQHILESFEKLDKKTNRVTQT